MENQTQPYIIISDANKPIAPAGQKFIKISGTYLHGELEKDAGSDNFLFLDKAPKEEGIYSCAFNGKPCNVYLWVSDFKNRGLVVYSDNIKDNQFALNAYNKKVVEL